jgi:hypothetical protein
LIFNCRSLPKFTAEASLYTTSGHYQVDRRVINSYRRTINAVHPAKDAISDEVIVIEDEAPGSGSGFPWGWGGGGHGGGHDGGGGVPIKERFDDDFRRAMSGHTV